MTNTLDSNLKKINFNPANEKQRRFLFSLKKYLMLSGAVAAGKSLLGCHKGFMLNMKYPGNRGLICRKEARSLPGSTIHTLLEQVIPSEWILNYNQMKGELIHKTPNPKINSTIMFSGLDKKADQTYPTKIGSTEYGWIFVDEGVELIEGDWMMLSTRLRYKIPTYSEEQNNLIPRQMFTATNPGSPYHWLHKFFIENQDKDREVIYTNPYENPFLPKGYLKVLENSLTGTTRERLLKGKWVVAEGVIYDNFSEEKHVVDESVFLPFKDYQMIIVGADSNYPNPRAAVLIGIRGNGIDILGEFYKTNSQVEELSNWLEEFYKKNDVFLTIYHDPSDPAAINKLSQIPGCSCLKADNTVVGGISEVSRYFNNDSIRINKKCVNLIKELLSYRWGINKDEDKPLKENDHACFVKGTKVLTLEGEKNIENIEPLDYVLTSGGWNQVRCCLKRAKQLIYEINLSNGISIKCTSDHPFWVKGKGWIKADSLRYLYILVDSLRYLWNLKSLTEGAIIKAKMDTGEETEDTTTCTETSGNIIMGKYRKAIKYIIKMAIKTITKYLILNVSYKNNTYRNIQKLKSKLKEIKNISKKLDLSLKNGIKVRKGENGIENIGKSHLKKHLSKESISVNNVEISLFQELHKELNSVIQTVSKKPYVLDVRKLKKKQYVYNLTVKDCHEYFANGILVSNCDALRYGLYTHKMNSGTFTLLNDPWTNEKENQI